MNIRMKIPGPDHPITIAENPKRVRISVGGEVIAETSHALTLKEASYPAVQYIPRADANSDKLKRTDHSTYCPYKGDASYFSIVSGGQTLENAIWTYETPYESVKEIEGHLAFYPNKVTIEEI
ncbi:hypothetical protein HMPREF9695_02643 [Afipia broomeae ATCC 49717]|uniref:DUF427 domain-containing protein n=2 Tax=Afipia broomeae TaxID=56946 RepID=K8P9F9_9BRAD|nr:hypothetical protein HMPREF9695_02643 [Afipia broomeae ATCC 49717]